jgi:osmotically inducible protein OsmC
MTVKEAIMATRKGWAVWKGGIKDGSGTISTETGVLHDAPYGFKSRFEKGEGTNPEELLAAAHAACFSMALSLFLGEAGLTPERIETHAAVTIDKVGEGFEITRSHLDVSAKIPSADNNKFQELANKAKAGCPVSKLFKAQITMDAKLES